MVVDCFRCGLYQIDSATIKDIQQTIVKDDPHKIAATSGWIRENQNEILQRETLEKNLLQQPLRVGEKADKLFNAIVKNASVGSVFMFSYAAIKNHFKIMDEGIPSTGFHLPALTEQRLKIAYYYMGISHSETIEEVDYLIYEYLATSRGLLINLDNAIFRISPSGWAYYENKGNSTDSHNAFVAMWFSENTNELWERGISRGIINAGYKPFRIDKHDHNNRIDDEIIASIRKSKFLVADFTGQRGGVYFEAGFALGLRQEVIWLCKKSELNDVHFDNRQYNFIVWQEGKWQELAERITFRIEATIGKGPIPV
jgi:nucleoside 2-deoxyribosyltransferase